MSMVQASASRSNLSGVSRPASLGVVNESGFESQADSLNDVAVKEFGQTLARNQDTAVAVAAIKALTTVIRLSTAQTMMGLANDLEAASAALQRVNPTAISLKAGCELFSRYTTRTSELEMADIERAKARLIERGNHFADTSTRARQTIAELGARFIRNNTCVVTHGYSRVVLALLSRAVNQGTHFRVMCTEGRPDGTGLRMADALAKMGIPTTIILDSAVAYALERVDMVLVGAEAVVENGGIINKLGTYQIAICAKAVNKPVYVAAESYKFARLYPLTQKDLPEERKPTELGPLLPPGVGLENPSRDYTPPAYLSLLVTDLGVLTPAAVSDELIQLYV
ncbi:eukaryotic initiation factor [Haematococcus lacustris]